MFATKCVNETDAFRRYCLLIGPLSIRQVLGVWVLNGPGLMGGCSMSTSSRGFVVG